MARTTGDTMAEGLQKTVQQIAGLMTLPDADLDFLMGIQEAIATYLQNGATSQGGNINLPQGPGMGGPSGAGLVTGGPGIGGLTPPNADELRRTMQMSQG